MTMKPTLQISGFVYGDRIQYLKFVQINGICTQEIPKQSVVPKFMSCIFLAIKRGRTGEESEKKGLICVSGTLRNHRINFDIWNKSMIFSNNVSYFCLEKVVVMIAFRNFGRYRKLLVNFNEMSYRTIRLIFGCIIRSGKSQKRSHYARNIPQKH